MGILKELYIDAIGATKHMMYHESELTNIPSCNFKVTILEENSSYARKKGDVKLEIIRDEMAILKYMYLVPNLIRKV